MIQISSIETTQSLLPGDGIAAKIPSYDAPLRRYVQDRSVIPNKALDTARRASVGDPWEFMQTTPDQASLLYLIAKLCSAKSILEIGCYFGHSAVALASALPEDGKLITLDHNARWAESAKSVFETAGLTDKIELRLGEAHALLDQLVIEKSSAPFDLIFIDADKINSHAYYERVMEILRPGGVILVDNVLWRGKINDPSDQSDRAVALRRLNDRAATDDRVESTIITISDGMLLVRKKG